MKNSFSEFELKVQLFCIPEDFDKNKHKLKSLRISSYDTFLCILKLGGKISNSIRVCEEIFNLSVQTHLTEIELVELSSKFRFINALIDEKGF